MWNLKRQNGNKNPNIYIQRKDLVVSKGKGLGSRVKRVKVIKKYKLPVIKSRLAAISEKAMASHSSTLAWKIPWTEEPGGLQSVGSLRVRHD